MLKAGKTLLFGALLALVFPIGATADGHKQIWACKARGADEEDLWLVSWGSQSYIKLYEQRVWGNHYKEDDNLRWDFGWGPGGTAKYSAILKPSMHLDYYDFTTAEPGQPTETIYRYRCRVAQS